MSKLNFDLPAKSKFYADVIEILNIITGIKWGYVKTRSRIKYLSSEEFPILIAATWKKVYKKDPIFDIKISNKLPSKFPSRDAWIDCVGAELQIKLLKILDNNLDKKIISRIKNWSCTTEYGNMILQADEQNRLYPLVGEPNTFDIFLDKCSELGFG